MRLIELMHKIASLPPRVVLTRMTGKVFAAWRSREARKHDQHAPTYAQEADVPRGELFRYVTMPTLTGTEELQEQGRAAAAEMYLTHRFDLLGSGWVEARHGTKCRGVGGHRYDPVNSMHPLTIDPCGNWLENRINPANLEHAKHIWSLVQQPYVPIDWQLDFKSGYRWSENTWSRDIRYGDTPGADVKVPWELARMQHLPQLAMAEGFPAERIAIEFRNQVLDFMATNPPRFGVNWVCTMDVAIRAANITLAYDLLRSRGVSFDAAFMALLRRSLQEHGKHIIEHLEWSPSLRSNHYLANLAGLLFIAAYMPVTWHTSAWLALAIQELGREWLLQFGADGGNFEGSTAYHRLSAEILVYAAALAEGLPEEKWRAMQEYDPRAITGPVTLAPSPMTYYPRRGKEHGTPFPPACWERLSRMRDFTDMINGTRGVRPQIGDNDSGRFFKLWPVWRRLPKAKAAERFHNLHSQTENSDGTDVCWMERQGHAGHLVAATDALMGRTDAPGWTAEQRAEAALIRSLANLAPTHPVPPPPPIEGHFRFFRQFGLYSYRINALSMLLRCGPVGQSGNGGHAHNDQLSLTVAVGGTQVFIDPGTFLYTPLPEERNRFRSTRMHNTLFREGVEQNRWLPGVAGLFSMFGAVDGRVTEATPDRWIGEHLSQQGVHRRTMTFNAVGFEAHEFMPGSGSKVMALHLANGTDVTLRGAEARINTRHYTLVLRAVGVGMPSPWAIQESLYSPAYGWREASRVLLLSFTGAELRWSLGVETR